MINRTIPAFLWTLAAVTFLSLEALSAHAFPGYSYSNNFISLLGESRSPLSLWMNFAFIAEGTLYVAAAVLSAKRTGRSPFLLFAPSTG